MYFSNKLVGIACAVLMAVVPLARADSLGVSEVENFHLTNDFLHKWQAYQAAAKKDICTLSILAVLGISSSNIQTLDQMAAAFDAKPEVHKALSKVGLTAKEYMTGHFLLANATGRYRIEQHPRLAHMFSQGNPFQQGLMGAKVSAENMAFFRKHQKEIRQSEELITPAMILSPDKVPNCLRQPTAANK